jgi:UDP-glucose 4-epimerase
MQIAITGASGRIGRAVTALAITEGHQVVAIDRIAPSEPLRSAVQLRHADIASYQAVAEACAGCDAIIHLAAYPTPMHHPAHEVHNNNVVGSYNILAVAAELGIWRVCQASSVNAIGAAYSRQPRYDYFPIDERHPTYNEDPYSLSKWVAEQQADSIARRYEQIAIASLRFHWIVPDRAFAAERGSHIGDLLAKHLWGYTRLDSAARACLQSVQADFIGHEVLQIIAPDTMMSIASLDLARQYFPDVPIRADLNGTTGFFSTARAKHVIGWQHDLPTHE